MSIIDIHTHAFPDAIAERALRQLQEGCPWKAVSDGKVKSLMKSMNKADIDVSVICTIATKPDESHVNGIFEWCKSIRSDRIEPLPSVHPRTPEGEKWVHRFADEHFAGIKLHPMYQDFAADESRMDPIYQAARECGLAVVSHCGRDIAFPETDDRAEPIRFRRVIDNFPGLKLICTHMGGWRMWKESQRDLVGTDVYMETSFSLDALSENGPQQALDMIRSHGVDKVLFGTDWPWQRQSETLKLLRDVGLTEDELHKILWSNSAMLLGY